MKPYSCLLILLVASLCFLSASGQEQYSGTQIISKTKEAFDLAFSDADSALKESQALVSSAKGIRDDLALANALNSVGWSFFHKGDLDSALFYLEASKEQFARLEKPEEFVQVSLNLAEVYSRNSNFNKALIHLFEGEKINQINKNKALETDLYRQFAIVYRELGYYDKAADFFQKAMNGFKAQNDIFRFVNTGISLSILYRKIGETDKSIALLNDLKLEHEKNKLSEYQLAMIYENLGETYFTIEDFKNALPQFILAHDLFSKLDFKADLAYESMNVGKTYTRLNKFDEAEFYLKKAYVLSDSVGLLSYKYESSLEMANLFAGRKKWNQAYEYAQLARVLGDSLKVEEEKNLSKELAEKYEHEKSQQEIALLKTKNELNESREIRNRVWIYFLLIITLFALLIIWLLVNKINLGKKLEYEKAQNRIAGEIEDERILNQFAVSLYGKNTVDDILWDVAQNCITLLGFEDCVMYVADKERKVLVQYAAAGPKTPQEERRIFNPIEIPFSKGIVGYVYHSGKAEIVNDTSTDARYIVDDESRMSEITVPIFVNASVYGIIDSENAKKNFFTERHLRVLERVASICSERILKLITEEKLRQNIARDLHDEVGSTITSINILSKLVMKENSIRQQEYLQKINDQSGRIMESMSDIIWAINPNLDTIEQTLFRMKEFAIELVESAGMVCRFETHLTGNIRNIQSEERKYIFLIYKEAIHNAVKYSRAEEIHISITHSDRLFSFSIKDNGVGFDVETAKYGNGIKNMRERANTIKAQLEVTSGSQTGTLIHFRKTASHD